MVFLHDADKAALLAEFVQRRQQREEAGDELVYYASASACEIGLDLIVSWSDGEEGSEPTGCKMLQLTWQEIAELALMFGRGLLPGTLRAACEMVAVEKERDGSRKHEET